MTTDHSGIKDQIRDFMSGSFDGQDIADDDDIFALGFGNSLFAIQLVAFVEGQFDIEIESEDLEMANFTSVAAVAALVGRKHEQDAIETGG